MLANLIIGCLTAILVAFIGTIIYFVSLVIHDSDEDQNRSLALGLDAQDFSSAPIGSPNDEPINHANGFDLSERPTSQAISIGNSSTASNRRASPSLHAGAECICTRRHRNLVVKASRLGEQQPESLRGVAAENFEEITADGVQMRTIANDSNSATREAAASTTSNDSPGAGTTSSQATKISASAESAASQEQQLTLEALKETLTTKYSAAVSKQTLDDCDPSEMRLGGSALHWCKTRRSLDRLIKLQLIGMEVRNNKNETALHVAIRRHKLSVLVGLLCYQADVEARNDADETPLILACKMNAIFSCQSLLIFDANPDAVDKGGHSARHYAAKACARHKNPQQAPSAAHLILAMLHAMGARRCPEPMRDRVSATTPMGGKHTDQTNQSSTEVTSSGSSVGGQHKRNAENTTEVDKQASRQASIRACDDGCSQGGHYDGNSYNRWSDYERECLHKKYMFSSIVESRLLRPTLGLANQLAKVWNWGKDGPSTKVTRSRLLSIDGGGLRGIVVCEILIELEKLLKRPIISYFDWVGGTSVGAFLACALCQGTTLSELRRICFDFKDEVFSGQRPYNSQFIERVLKRTFGIKRRMSDIRGRKLAVTTTLADRDPCQLRFFRNYKSPAHLLAAHGFAPEIYNNLSGHTIIPPRIVRETVTGTRNDITTRSVSSNLSFVEREPSTTRAAAQLNSNQKRSTIVDSSEGNSNIGGGVSINNNDPEDDDSQSTRDDGEISLANLAISDNEIDPLLWQAVRASAAAPFFFKPYGPFLDGGIISNNPTLDLLGEFESHQKVREFLRANNRPLAEEEATSRLDMVVSIGTGRGRVIGRQAMIDFGQVASGFATVFSPVELVRSIRAARDLFKKLIHQSCHTEDHVVDRAQAWCSSLDIPYFRVNPPLATIFSIDDKRDEQLINAMWQTKLYMRSMKNQLEELAQLLERND